MSDVLSQSEIDNLLAAINSGELDTEELKDTDEKQVKDYDFARPSKFSKEHLRTLETIFEHYGRLIQTNLPAYLRKNVAVEVVNSEAVAYSEFANALSNPVLLGIISLPPLKGNCVMEMANNLGYTIIDRLLGGVGTPLEKPREFSEIELVVIERILNICTNLLQEPWHNVVDLSPRLVRIETNSQYAQVISPQEMTAIVTLNIKIGNIEGLMNFCLPFTALEDVMDKLNTKYWFSSLQEKDSTSYEQQIEGIIDRAQIPVRVVLGKSVISVNDFVNLQPGDVIRLNTKTEDELDAYVGNLKKFKTLPGVSSGLYAARVTEVIREEK
jgi:flagellar motor switch protein FliM